MILAERYNYTEEFHKRSLATLETALASAPAYRAWRTLDPGPAAPPGARFDALPALTKEIMREHFPAGLAPKNADVEGGLLREEIEYTFTSGTTGERVVNIWDQNWWDRSEAAAWKLNAHTARLAYPQREAKLASSLNVGISCEEDLPYSARLAGRKLYLNEKINIIQWQPRHFVRMARELAKFRPAVLEANPSLLARLAYWALDENVKLYSPEVIVFTYEFESRIHLAAIRRAFDAPQISSYGTTETGFVMQQCECGLMHQNTEFCRIDFLPLKEQYGGPELGRLYVTTFQNPWNIVLRFDTGDLARLHPLGVCGCGRREGMIVERVEGRVSNVTFTPDGGLVTTAALDDALAKAGGIRDYHFEQRGRARYGLRVMPERGNGGDGGDGGDNGDGGGDGHRGGDGAIIDGCRAALEGLYGSGCEFEISLHKNILPGPAGKFRRTQANFDYDVEELFV